MEVINQCFEEKRRNRFARLSTFHTMLWSYAENKLDILPLVQAHYKKYKAMTQVERYKKYADGLLAALAEVGIDIANER